MTKLFILDLNGVPMIDVGLGPEPPKYREGDAKWNEIARPRRDALTEFDSKAMATMTIDALIDFYPNGDIEPQIDFIEGLTRIRPGQTQPAVMRLAGPVPHREKRWVLTSVEEGALVQRRPDTRRSRQQLTLSFLEYNPADLILAPPPPSQAAAQAAAPAGAAAPSGRTYTVKRGDTLSTIAARELGSAGRWGEIATLNGLRDPNRITPGQVLRLP